MHSPESGNGCGERRSRRKDNDAGEEHRFSRDASEQISGRQASYSEAQGENRREKAGICETESEGFAYIRGEHWKQVAVRGHQGVADEQNAIHRDGYVARARFALHNVRLRYCCLALNGRVLPFLAESGAMLARVQDILKMVLAILPRILQDDLHSLVFV